MSTITDSQMMVDELTRSMVEVDAAAARAALADRLQVADVDLDHPAVVAVLAAVVAGWRPPITPGGHRILTDPAEDPHDLTLFGDSGGIASAAAEAPPGRPR